MSEYGRRAIHASGVGMPAIYLLDIVTWIELRYFMLAVTVIVFILEFLRLVVGLTHRLYDEITRPYEQHAVAGYALYMVSMTTVAVLFGPSVTIPAMLMLILGDPISGMLGNNAADEHKRPAVVVATFGVCFLLAVPFTIAGSSTTVGVAAAGIGAAVGAVADGVKPVIRGVGVDDNLTIPPVVAVGIVVTFWLFGVDTGFAPLWA
ncbi:diacylglycerol/polyprenol kinase family protein [Halonotius pteroides]|uniref:Dolichol kinase n=1 Tax=Halonotius pteroides TaxID=268735 RepID=A0A3A6QSQ3_9EURY|nr:dolichol kinase [Halonotius pteroides]RJX51537.1 dolichol kinase [Halonotius pteroides]